MNKTIFIFLVWARLRKFTGTLIFKVFRHRKCSGISCAIWQVLQMHFCLLVLLEQLGQRTPIKLITPQNLRYGFNLVIQGLGPYGYGNVCLAFQFNWSGFREKLFMLQNSLLITIYIWIKHHKLASPGPKPLVPKPPRPNPNQVPISSKPN